MKCFFQMSKENNNCYETTYFEKDADGKPKGANIFAVKEAKDVRSVTDTAAVTFIFTHNFDVKCHCCSVTLLLLPLLLLLFYRYSVTVIVL